MGLTFREQKDMMKKQDSSKYVKEESMNIKILYEDSDIIVVVKPAGMPSQGDRSATMDMVSYLKNYLARTSGNTPYIGIVHRLDQPVGGIMVYAKNARAAANLSLQIQNHRVEKYYLAVLSGTLTPGAGVLENDLLKNEKSNLSSVTDSKNKKAKKAKLEYRTIEICPEQLSLVEIHLLTGRHHQIRVQTSYAGCGIYGDTKYNSYFKDKKGWYPLGLFSYKLGFEHPVTKKWMTFEEKPEGKPFDQFTGMREEA